MESALICHGHQKGEAMLYRGAAYMAKFVEKVRLEIIADDLVRKIIEVIGTVAKTGRMDDCRIFILPFVEAC